MEQPGGDCNDANATAYPMALEVCGNGVDDDCDGRVDEACNVCSTGAMCAVNESCSQHALIAPSRLSARGLIAAGGDLAGAQERRPPPAPRPDRPASGCGPARCTGHSLGAG